MLVLLDRAILIFSDAQMYEFSAAPTGFRYAYIKRETLQKYFLIFDEHLQLQKYSSLVQAEYKQVKQSFENWWRVFDEVVCNEERQKEYTVSMQLNLLKCAEGLAIVRAALAAQA